MKSETIRDKTTTSRKSQQQEPESMHRALDEDGAGGLPAPSKLIVKFRHQIHIVPIDSIDYVESAKRKVLIYTDHEIFQMYSTMKDMAKRLPEHFVRCHNSFFVNIDRVATGGASTLTLQSGVVIPISRRYAKQIRERLQKITEESFPSM